MYVIWYIPVLAKIIVANGFFPLILKRNVGLHSRTKRFFLQYLFCAILAIVAGLTFMPISFDGFTLAIVVLGFFNGLAAYCQWRAVDISLSRTSLFTFWDDIIAMTLSYFILHEARFLNAGIIAGITLSFGAVILFTAHRYRISPKKEKKNADLPFYLYVLTYSIIWGLATFLMKFFGLKSVAPGTFLVAWYVGALLSALLLLFTYHERPLVNQKRLTAKDVFGMLQLSICIMVALFLTYWSYKLAPQNIIQPMFLIGEMVFPTLIGLYIFSEVKDLSAQDKFYFILAIAGGALIALSFNI